MKQKASTYLLFFGLMFLAACSLFKKIPVREDNNQNTASISWDDSNYDYNTELSGHSTMNPENRNDYRTDIKFIDHYSGIFGFNLNGIENKALITESSGWIGTIYKYGSEEKQVATDCSGFVKSVIKTVYDIDLNRTAAGMAAESKKLKINELKEGDLVFFKIGSSDVSHVGIYIKDNYFIHASTSNGVIVSSLDEDYYSKHFCCGGRIK